jgi:hypothetical protein
MLTARVALLLLDRLRRSPFGGPWLAGARLRVDCGNARLLAATDRVCDWDGTEVDAVLRTSEADLDAMLAGAPPAGEVGWVLGERADTAPRIRQARAVLALAALGWCGPWPDLAIGPADRVSALFPPGAPPELAAVSYRFTDGARPRHTTLGLSDRPGAPEFTTDLHPRALRVAVIHWLETGSLPATLTHDALRLGFRTSPLPLPHAASALVVVVPA